MLRVKHALPTLASGSPSFHLSESPADSSDYMSITAHHFPSFVASLALACTVEVDLPSFPAFTLATSDSFFAHQPSFGNRCDCVIPLLQPFLLLLFIFKTKWKFLFNLSPPSTQLSNLPPPSFPSVTKSKQVVDAVMTGPS